MGGLQPVHELDPRIDAGSGGGAVAAAAGLSGLAANTSYHYRIVAENELGVSFGADEVFTTSGPPRISSAPTSAIGHQTAIINAKVNPGELETKYRFEYGETTAYGTEVPVGGASIPAGSSAVAVSASLSSLKLGVTYHYRVVASNSAGSTVEPDQSFETIAPAPIDSTSAAGVSATQATLETRIDPLGNDTTYAFQYGTNSCNTTPTACTSIPSPPADIGSGETDVPESQTITGLTPATTYHYRVIDHNTLGTSEGHEQTFTTQPATATLALPDDRAWEMITPPNKQGAPVEALTREGGLILAAENGNSLAYVADGALGEEAQGNRSPEWQQILATRTADGWSSKDIQTPSGEAQGHIGESGARSTSTSHPTCPRRSWNRREYRANHRSRPASHRPRCTCATTPTKPTCRWSTTRTCHRAPCLAGRSTSSSATPDLSHVVLDFDGRR